MNKQRFIIFVLLISLAILSGPGAAHISAAPPPAPALPVPSVVEGSQVEGPVLPVPSVVEGSQVEGPVLPVSSVADDPAIAPDFGKLPLSFVPNAGQTDPAVHFEVHGMGGRLFFTPGEVVLSLPTPVEPQASRFDLRDKSGRVRNSQPIARNAAVLRLHFEGANPTPEVTGAERLPGIVNYFIGNDPAKWRTNLPTYAGVVYRELYPGVDLHYDGTEGLLKGTYTVAPGADPGRIRWRYDGATSVRVDEATGDLLIQLPAAAGAGGEGRTLTEHAPIAWQSIDGQRVPVRVRYAVAGDGSNGFALGDYDPAHPLTLDPTLLYSTYLGGSDTDVGSGIAVDSAGSAYVTGMTYSTDFPNASGTLGGSEDAFVAKLNVAGNALLYSTYLGGSGTDEGQGIAVDSDGNAYVTGWTSSTDFPTANPLQATNGGGRDVFVTKLNAAGSALVYSTYLGGSSIDGGGDIAVNSTGDAFVVGDTFSTDFPTANPLQATYGGGTTDAFMSKLNAAGNTLLYSTYLGGSGTDEGQGIAVDSDGNACVTGWTTSTDFPTANPLQSTNNGGPHDAFVAKLNAAGSALVYSTYLGGSDVWLLRRKTYRRVGEQEMER